MYIKAIPPPVLNEIWLVTFELHTTNNDLRARGHELYVTTEVRVSPDTGHIRNGIKFLRSNGSDNLTVAGHHDLASRSKSVEWTPALIKACPAKPTLKLIVRAGSDAAKRGDRLVIGQGRGFLQLMRWVPG